jgi:hypothetical protein
MVKCEPGRLSWPEDRAAPVQVKQGSMQGHFSVLTASKHGCPAGTGCRQAKGYQDAGLNYFQQGLEEGKAVIYPCARWDTVRRLLLSECQARHW